MHFILDGHFSHIIFVKFVIFISKEKINEKEAVYGLFFKKLKTFNFSSKIKIAAQRRILKLRHKILKLF